MDTASKSSEVMNSKSLDNISKVSSSLADPSAMYKNCCNSLSERLAEPSAMFTGIEVHALLICDVRPNLSSEGNFEVSEYNLFTRLKLCFHASKFWCGFIAEFFMKFTAFHLTEEIGNREIASKEMENREIGNRLGANAPIQSFSNCLFPVTSITNPINYLFPIFYFLYTIISLN